MAFFAVVAVVPDSVAAMVVCRSSASGRVLVRNWQIILYASYLTCSLLLLITNWPSLLVIFFLVLTHFYFLASGHTSRGHRCRPSLPPPDCCLHLILAHRAQHPLTVDFSTSVTNSRSRAFRKSTCAQYDKIYEYAFGEIRMHNADLYRARGSKPIRHRGNEWYRAGRPGGLVGFHSNTNSTINTCVGPWVKYPPLWALVALIIWNKWGRTDQLTAEIG